MRNDFLEKSYTKCGETIPRPFAKKLKLSHLWINSLTFYTVCFYCMPSWGLSKYIETKQQTTCFYFIQKEVLNQTLPHFLHDFWRNIFLLLYSINWPHLIVWFNCFLTRILTQIFKLTLSFQSNRFSYKT